ncbi:MAG: LiaF transmembrane domain-containing protein [Promethearchaeota archaeon]
MKNSKISGIILILVGIFIFLHNWNYNLFQWRWAWNIGILVFGIIIFLKAITDSRRQGLFWGSFLSLLGIYLTLGTFNLFWISRGLTIIMVFIFLGISFYMMFFFKTKKLLHFLFGLFFVAIGIFFFLIYFQFLPLEYFYVLMARYWPVLFIVSGLFILINSITKQESKT